MDNLAVELDSTEPKTTNESTDVAKTPDNVEKAKFEIVIEDQRDTWGNKMEFILATIGYAVGLGNIWRFPYLCQKNGGGAFLIPYLISLILLGIPLFFLELAIGQKLRKGAMGTWNAVSPALAGVGITSFVASLYCSIYYNMIVGWCFYYLFISFQGTLPYQDCPTFNNLTIEECEISGESSYYWYRVALDTGTSISESGVLQWHLCMVLLLSWLVVFFCTARGVKSTGKVVYFTAVFPYIVLVIFFFRGVTLEGAGSGLKRMFTPDFDKLGQPQVWFEAATQIFFSLGIAFGGLIAMSSYNPVNNNCKRDAIMVSLINCGTSVFASVVVFSILGFKATKKHGECWEMVRNNQTNSSECGNIDDYLSEIAQGPGLTFIAFTEAITRMPVPQLWAVLFFTMLLTLGLGSMFGQFAGVVTPLVDSKLFPVRKEIINGVSCIVCYLIGLVFCLNSGQYWIQLFNDYSISLALLVVGLVELIIITFVYGVENFLDDIELMIGTRPGWYWKITWKFIGPPLAFLLLVGSFVDMGRFGVIYVTWDKIKGKTIESVPYPTWGKALIGLIILSALAWVPLVAFLRRFIKHQKKNYTMETVETPNGTMMHSVSQLGLTINEQKTQL